MSTQLNVGDEVQWMTVSHQETSINYRTKYGKIEILSDAHATVKLRRSSKREFIATRRLVPINQPSPVNHVFGALTEESLSQPEKQNEK